MNHKSSIVAVTTVCSMALAGCMTVPARYEAPARLYMPAVERMKVSGFARTEFLQTGGSYGSLSSPQYGLYGFSGGWSGEHREVSDASAFRWFLEETRCFGVVSESGKSNLRVEGKAIAKSRTGAFNSIVGVLEAFTLTPIFGVPFPDGADGQAVARVYQNGQFVKSYQTEARLTYGTTLYTMYSDGADAKDLVRGMALRDLADQVAGDFCQQ